MTISIAPEVVALVCLGGLAAWAAVLWCAFRLASHADDAWEVTAEYEDIGTTSGIQWTYTDDES